MEKIKATAGILSFNSARTLTRALKSVQAFDDILICDGGSTDGTKDIAAKFGARIIDQPQHGRISDFSLVRNHMLQNAKYEWFLYIDSDEYLNSRLRKEIIGVIDRDVPGVYMFQRKYLLGNEIIEHASGYPNLQIRLFHKSCVNGFIKPVHERPDLKSEFTPQVLPGIQYVPLDDVKSLVQKHNRYITLEIYHRTDFTWFIWFRIVPQKLLRVFGRLIRIIAFRFRYPWSKCLPLRYEWLAIRYSLLLIFRLCPVFPRPRI